jgi:FKBP-type peptidyl-prolyl cis-trans isomerase
VRRQQRQQRRRRVLTSGVAVVIVALVVLALVVTVGSSNNTASSTSTSSSSSSTAPTTTVAKLPSAAGKPCVAVKGPLPKGAPAVPVHLGKPPTNLVTRDLKAGTGAVVKATQTVSVDYIGVSCSTGKIFDSSYSRGQPASFPLNRVIKGWTDGIAGMKVGGERLLGIPPALGYGTAGQPPDIAPNETLWFVVHVISAK